ncbi:deoxyribonuclease-1 [Stegostoma tigrinum]|uniref:deoxyribonuclease-1 n=1 Tax=Stegostoma tigrinum TaxID=3053191 RepID=UPI00202B6F8E|nr:deoxyribonuclease-1 [Stegostoma tigrinum]XP_048407858.1 deoxyribonuclease-1 [Stegostoma tigrinum]XP_048407860.1 deoxyribonuclease-1 [Stegostoma tigrinum]XP_059510020.1 deoxyribonuclease-1 [Stegostoma tigrinum]
MNQLITVLILACALNTVNSVKISAFNIKTFGDSKMLNATIANIIVNLVRRYDIILIQEVRDADLSAVRTLMNKLNSSSKQTYSYTVSDPLGHSTYKERYLFVYRNSVVSVVNSYLYNDGSETTGHVIFSREPFLVKFSSRYSDIPDFIIMPQHTSPSSAVKEIDALYDVFLDARIRLGTDNMLIMGDLNADCSYVKPTDWAHIRLRKNSQFQWLIPDSADTTCAITTNCAYDRIIAVGSEMKNAVIDGSAGVYNFTKVFSLSIKMTLSVSDHYPVEVSLGTA